MLFRYSRFLVFLLAFTGLLTSCDKEKCGCAPPPKEAITTTSLTRVDTWWLHELTSAAQLTRDNDIKDRYAMRFRADGSYTQILLADNTEFVGTWMLMGTDNSTLHLTDHKGTSQEYKIEGVGAESMAYSRTDKTGQIELFSFKSTR